MSKAQDIANSLWEHGWLTTDLSQKKETIEHVAALLEEFRVKCIEEERARIATWLRMGKGSSVLQSRDSLANAIAAGPEVKQ